MNEVKNPWEHCDNCELYKNNKCHVAFKFQRLPRSKNGLGMCKKIKKG